MPKSTRVGESLCDTSCVWPTCGGFPSLCGCKTTLSSDQLEFRNGVLEIPEYRGKKRQSWEYTAKNGLFPDDSPASVQSLTILKLQLERR